MAQFSTGVTLNKIIPKIVYCLTLLLTNVEFINSVRIAVGHVIKFVSRNTDTENIFNRAIACILLQIAFVNDHNRIEYRSQER